MSRTYHATGTGSFTRAKDVRSDRSSLRAYNKDPKNRMNQELEPMHGATSSSRRGAISYEEAQKLIKNGDKIKTPDGQLHKVTAQNRDELIGRLGATIQNPAKDFGRAAKGGNKESRGTIERHTGNLSNGTAKVSKGGQKGQVDRVPNTKLGKAINAVLPKGILEGIGRGTGPVGSVDLGFKPQVGPTSTYKAGTNSKNTAIKAGRAESKGNTKLNVRGSKVGGFAPRSSRSVVTKAFADKRKANQKQRDADKKAGVVKTVKPRGPRKAPPAGTLRSSGKLKNIKGARTSKPTPRKGGRSGEGRSK